MRDSNPRGLAPNPLSKSANRDSEESAGLHLRSQSDVANASGRGQTRTTETNTETGLSPSFLAQEETAWSRDASQEGAERNPRGGVGRQPGHFTAGTGLSRSPTLVIYDMILQQFRPVGRGRRRGDLPVNDESVLIFMVLAAGGLTGHRGGLHLGQPQPARDLVDVAIATRMDCRVVAYKAGVTIRFVVPPGTRRLPMSVGRRPSQQSQAWLGRRPSLSLAASSRLCCAGRSDHTSDEKRREQLKLLSGYISMRGAVTFTFCDRPSRSASPRPGGCGRILYACLRRSWRS